MSIATIDKPEFINITPYNPLISQCEIKVMYVGENRNHSYITKEVAAEMANTLPGCPIVGYYKEDKKDFMDHGDRVIFDGEGIKFECLTKPYGFISPDARVWFQKFEDTDEFGNVEVRDYLMTTGYLWTGQFEEAQQVLDGGKPHSMELDKETLDGKWSKKQNSNIELFIINDGIFSKLCILGDDIEPCFEGSSITAPQISTSFTKVDDDFKKTLYSMMQELKFALKGGQQMAINKIDTPSVEEVKTEFSVEQDKFEKTETAENQKSTEESVQTSFAVDDKKKEEEEDKKEKKDASDSDSEKKDNTPADKEDKEEEDKKKNYSLLEEKYNTLETKYNNLEQEYRALVDFKNQIEDEKKDALIKSFYMLSDEDKADVIANKSQYSLDDIEAKLSVICVRKKVNFDLEDASEDSNEENPITTFNLNTEETSVPAWVRAVRNTKNSKNN